MMSGRDDEPRRRWNPATPGLIVLHAVLFALAFPPVNAWPLAVLAPAPLALASIRARSTRGLLLTVLVVQWLLWLWMDQWLIPITIVGYPMKALVMALYACALAWIVRRLARHPRTFRWPQALVLPVAWVGVECLRGEFAFNGYPWYLLAHPLVEWPVLVQSADLAGAYLVSLIAAAVSGAIVDVVRWCGGQMGGRLALTSGGAVAVLVGANLAYGQWRMAQVSGRTPGPRVLAIQTNLPQSNKIGWTVQQQAEDVAAFIELTREAYAATGDDADLIVWPETMLPVRGLEIETLETLWRYGYDHEVRFADAIIRLSEELGTPMLIGASCYVGLRAEGERWVWDKAYNSAYLVEGTIPEQRYDKYFLTPFGEVMPYISNWTWLEQRLLALGAPGMSFDLDSSPDLDLLRLEYDDRAVRMATPICFEDTMARVVRRMIWRDGRKAAGLLVNLSNDGWFTTFDAGRAQHVQIARFRCIENRVPMIRCANTGLSVSIDSSGNVVGTIGDGRYGTGRRAGWLAAVANLDPRQPPYAIVGEKLAWACFAGSVVFLISSYIPGTKG
jgi:apolipoprotein N-acyltransferase